MDNLKKLKIGVVAGGISSERDISLKSGKAVHESLSKNGFSSKLIDIESKEQLKSLETYKGLDLVFIMIHGKGGEDGEIQSILEDANIKYTGSDAASSLNAFDKLRSKELLLSLTKLPMYVYEAEKGYLSFPRDVVNGFSSKPYIFKKDGTSMSIDYIWGKLIHHKKGLLQVIAKELDKGKRANMNKALTAFEKDHPLESCTNLFFTDKWIVKPSKEGSSIGISVVELDEEVDRKEFFLSYNRYFSWRWFQVEKKEVNYIKAVLNTYRSFFMKLKDSIEQAFEYDDTVIVEPFVEGKELTVAVLGEKTFPAIEIKSKNDFYDFSAKYDKAGTQYVPAKLSSERESELSLISLNAFKRLGCSTWGRVDLIDTGEEFIFLEVNTVPGMTETSLVPKAAKLAGLSFNDFLVEIIKASID